MDCDLGRYDFEAFHNQINIFFNGSERLVVGIEIFHLRAFYYIQKVELHAEQPRDRRNISYRIQHIVVRFARKSQNKVHDGFYPACRQLHHCLIKNAQIVTSVYQICTVFVYCLKSEFDPEKMGFVDFGQKV